METVTDRIAARYFGRTMGFGVTGHRARGMWYMPSPFSSLLSSLCQIYLSSPSVPNQSRTWCWCPWSCWFSQPTVFVETLQSFEEAPGGGERQGKAGMLQPMGSQRVSPDWETEEQQRLFLAHRLQDINPQWDRKPSTCFLTTVMYPALFCTYLLLSSS